MRCPFCKVDNDKVIDTRPSEDGGVIRRRRECINCNKRFTTHERLEEMPVRVVKKSGRREPFDRSKILSGVMRAVEKRSISTEVVENLVDEIERQVLASEREIASQDIGELVMTKLRAMDEVAYVRFASVYREYRAVDEFIKEIRDITPAPDPAVGDTPDEAASEADADADTNVGTEDNAGTTEPAEAEKQE